MKKRIGIVGLGFIGGYLYRRIVDSPSLGLEVAFVWNRSSGPLATIPAELVIHDLSAFAETEPDLIVEVAHPKISWEFGESFLRQADYMPSSVTALSEDSLRERLVAAAENNGYRLFVPHGALVGADALLEQRDNWAEVTITFRKHPDNIDFSESGIEGGGIREETVVYEGPVRGIASRFPRNVNTMVTCALASLGLDKTRAVLIADPTLDRAVAEVKARGRDGAEVTTRIAQPAVGVSGTEMQESIFLSVLAATGQSPGIAFV